MLESAPSSTNATSSYTEYVSRVDTDKGWTAFGFHIKMFYWNIKHLMPECRGGCFYFKTVEVGIVEQTPWSIKHIGFTILPFILKVCQSLRYKSVLNVLLKKLKASNNSYSECYKKNSSFAVPYLK